MLKRAVFVAAGLTFAAAFAVLVYRSLDSSPSCDVCYRPMHEETLYRIHLAGGESLDVCCPRCGLRFQEGREDVVSAEVTDFSTRKRLDAGKAIYVENSSAHFCSHEPVREDRSGTQYEVSRDRCLPGIIAFESESAARTFQARNGGVIQTYAELLPEGSR